MYFFSFSFKNKLLAGSWRSIFTPENSLSKASNLAKTLTNDLLTFTLIQFLVLLSTEAEPGADLKLSEEPIVAIQLTQVKQKQKAIAKH